jgi:hypothetical protein
MILVSEVVVGRNETVMNKGTAFILIKTPIPWNVLISYICIVR